MKVSDLQGAALDWAVAKCEGFPIERKQYSDPDDWVWYYNGLSYYPSEDWSQGGPIIERECIQLTIDRTWVATLTCEDKKFGGVECFELRGPTPLIAAMRCYVASRLGDEIEIPEELKGE